MATTSHTDTDRCTHILDVWGTNRSRGRDLLTAALLAGSAIAAWWIAGGIDPAMRTGALWAIAVMWCPLIPTSIPALATQDVRDAARAAGHNTRGVIAVCWKHLPVATGTSLAVAVAAALTAAGH